MMLVKKKRKRRESDNDEEEEEKKTKFLFFDFECMQETGVHVPNLVVVQDGGHEWVFKGANTCKDFFDWLFGVSMDGSVSIAHNFKGYDSYFILKYLYDNKVLPCLIMKGAKIMEMTVSESDIKFIDSLNFLPMPLSKFPKTFGFTELAKGYFPHFFNTETNQHYVTLMAWNPRRGRPFTSGIMHSMRNGSSLRWKKNCSNIPDRTSTFYGVVAWILSRRWKGCARSTLLNIVSPSLPCAIWFSAPWFWRRKP